MNNNIDLAVIGEEIYRSYQRFTHRRGKRPKTMPTKIEHDRLYSPTEVANFLSCSYSTALHRMKHAMRDFKDLSVRSGKRIKQLPRVTGSSLVEYMERMKA